MENYPDSWPCKCGHRKDKHSQADLFSKTWSCLVLSSGNELCDPSRLYIDDCLMFKPVDNLTLVEMLVGKESK